MITGGEYHPGSRSTHQLVEFDELERSGFGM